ncbi:outer membrane beta-barrel protein [Geotalea sp. SG265]|uniref:outer membrane beta-barrel protein n=1 Tax=Geotalea sp. SG265 TaxID=2922867 RepID=UPI001FAF2C7C|nr:outer membrane beta-barrel protein [Geotalea sp. SG265]
MKKIVLLSLLIAFLLSVNSSQAADGGDKPANYFAIKGGIYSPTDKFDLQAAVGSSTTHRLDSKIGFNGELAVGHYFLPALAMELGAGYFESRGTAEEVAGADAKLRAVPVVVTAKVLLPLGPLEPYGEFGVGGYFSKLYRGGDLPNKNIKAIFGLHAGAGINFNVTDAAFFGFEGRYIWTEPSWGTTDVRKLDGFTATADLGFRY